ncbi:alpha/beta hydrolase, partial [Mycobacterium sp. ITM-2017-0098]
WGRRDYGDQWREVMAPTLLVEAGAGVTPPGQMRTMAETARRARADTSPGAGHLVHDDAPGKYQEAVEAFLTSFTRCA